MAGSLLVPAPAIRTIGRLFTASCLVLASACAGGLPTSPDARAPLDPPPAPVPGWVQLRLVTPWADDGVVQFTIVGSRVEEVIPASGLSGYAGVVDGGVSARLVLTGAIASGTVARLRVPDINRIAGFQVHIGQVAARGTYALRSSTLGYQAEVVR